MVAFFIGTIDPLIQGVDAVFKHQLLGHSSIKFFLGDPILVQHFLQAIFLADTIFFRTGLIIGGRLGTVGVIAEGVIGDGNEAGVFRHGQILQFLAEIGSSSTLNAIAATTKIDDIQIILQNDILVISLFKFKGTEDLQ